MTKHFCDGCGEPMTGSNGIDLVDATNRLRKKTRGNRDFELVVELRLGISPAEGSIIFCGECIREALQA